MFRSQVGIVANDSFRIAQFIFNIFNISTIIAAQFFTEKYLTLMYLNNSISGNLMIIKIFSPKQKKMFHVSIVKPFSQNNDTILS